ncbi:iron complex transport system permease protein [Micrococcales bacterium KH10]|nr:iron complex transport system permease protein [Micrococcales bacterium KH10]
MTSTVTPARIAAATQLVAAGRHRRSRRRIIAVIALAAGVLVVFTLSLIFGHTTYSLTDVLRVIAGQEVAGASFTVGELRLPRATLAVLSGFAFGIAGVTFQSLLRNPLAAPDIIGISSGASAAAVVAIILLSWSPTAVSLAALAGALVTALAIYLLSRRGSFAGARLILIGIGIAAMLDSFITYVLSRAAAWDVQTAMQWLTGSVNGANWGSIRPLAIAVAVIAPLIFMQARNFAALGLGDDAAAALGVRVERTRLTLVLGAVGLMAFGTAGSGPIAFVAFMAGPIAGRIVGAGRPPLLAAGLVGALLVLIGDFLGQYAFGTRYPVGVVTGALGAPFLIYLLIRTYRAGGS